MLAYIGFRGLRLAVWRGRGVPCDTMAVAVLCRVTGSRVTGGRVTVRVTVRVDFSLASEGFIIEGFN